MLFLSLFLSSGLLLQGFKLLFRYLTSKMDVLKIIDKSSSSKVKITGKPLGSEDFYHFTLTNKRESQLIKDPLFATKN